MLLPGSHHALTGCVISLVSSSVSQTFKPETFRDSPPPASVKLRGFGLPWAGLAVGWHRATVPPNSARSGKSHRARTAASSGVYRSPPHDGCTATRVYSETSRGRCGRSPCEQRAGDGCNRLLRRDSLGRNEPTQTRPRLELTAAEGECRRCSRVKRLLCRHKHGNYFPVFVPLWLVNLRSYCPPLVLPVGPLLNSPFSAGTPAASPVSRRVAFSAILFLLGSSRS